MFTTNQIKTNHNDSWKSILCSIPKPHQEHIPNIADRIHRSFISYKALNKYIKPLLALPLTITIPLFSNIKDEVKLNTFRVLICNQSISPHKPVMPVPINNGLPQTAIDIGKTKNDSSLWVLYDTGAALSTGNLDDHTQTYKDNPELVFKFETSDDPNGFSPVKLGAAVNDSNPDSANTSHGLLTAVIWYHTPFTYPSGQPYYLMFALSKDVSVSSIIGWPMILELEMNLLVSKQQIHSTILNVIFLII